MADQATMTNGPDVRINSPFIEGVIGNLAEFGNDTFELVELQARLAAIDAKEAADRATIHVALIAVGALLVLGLMPIALAGVALLIAEPLGISIGLALLLTAGVALLLAALLGFIAFRGLRNSLGSFDRSREELTRNLSWIRTVLATTSRRQPVRYKGQQGRGQWSYPRPSR